MHLGRGDIGDSDFPGEVALHVVHRRSDTLNLTGHRSRRVLVVAFEKQGLECIHRKGFAAAEIPGKGPVNFAQAVHRDAIADRNLEEPRADRRLVEPWLPVGVRLEMGPEEVPSFQRRFDAVAIGRSSAEQHPVARLRYEVCAIICNAALTTDRGDD